MVRGFGGRVVLVGVRGVGGRYPLGGRCDETFWMGIGMWSEALW